MDELKLAFEVLYLWISICTFIGLMGYGLYLFLELWETDRKNILILLVAIAGGLVTGIIWALIK